MRPVILFILSGFIAISASGQDKIYKRNRQAIKVRVEKVDEKDVIYKNYNDPAGPDHSISKKTVMKIVYENGTEEVMYRGGRRPVLRKLAEPKVYTDTDYGNNIVSIAPTVVGQDGLASGISYEHMLGKKGRFSFYLPVNYSYMGFGSSESDTDPIALFDIYNTAKYTLQLSPGIKFYPFGSKAETPYAIGLLLHYQQGYTQTGGWSGGYRYRTYTAPDKVRLQKIGLVVNNSVNLFPTPKFYIGIDLGLGFTIVNKVDRPYSDVMYEKGSDMIAQLSFRFGYRF